MAARNLASLKANLSESLPTSRLCSGSIQFCRMLLLWRFQLIFESSTPRSVWGFGDCRAATELRQHLSRRCTCSWGYEALHRAARFCSRCQAGPNHTGQLTWGAQLEAHRRSFPSLPDGRSLKRVEIRKNRECSARRGNHRIRPGRFPRRSAVLACGAGWRSPR